MFLFARDMVASVARPLLELKGVGKIALQPGEAGTVCFKLAAAALAFPGDDLKPVLEPAEFLLLAGQSADPRGLLTINVRALPGGTADTLCNAGRAKKFVIARSEATKQPRICLRLLDCFLLRKLAVAMMASRSRSRFTAIV